MSRITLAQGRILVDHLRKIPDDKIVVIRRVIALFLYHTALENGKLIVPQNDDLLSLIQNGATKQDYDDIFASMKIIHPHESTLHRARVTPEIVANSDYDIVNCILALVFNDSKMLARKSEPIDYPMKYLGDLSTIEWAMLCAGVPQIEIYPKLSSLMDMK